MVVFKCHLSEDTFRKYGGVSGTIYKICEHLKGEPAYKESAILVSNDDQNGNFYICLGGDVNKKEVTFEVTL